MALKAMVVERRCLKSPSCGHASILRLRWRVRSRLLTLGADHSTYHPNCRMPPSLPVAVTAVLRTDCADCGRFIMLVASVIIDRGGGSRTRLSIWNLLSVLGPRRVFSIELHPIFLCSFARVCMVRWSPPPVTPMFVCAPSSSCTCFFLHSRTPPPGY